MAVARLHLAQADQRAGALRQPLLETRAPLGQRQVHEIDVAVSQDVERDERDVLRGAGMSRREVDAALQLLEPGWLASVVECDDLAVEDHGRAEIPPHVVEGADDFRELRRLLVAQPRPDAGWRAGWTDGPISIKARMPSYFGS